MHEATLSNIQKPIALSVVVITFNEERNIGRCLASVKAIADEILVVDSLSTDRTREIAKELGAKVIEQPFLGHIGQKNFAMQQARYDYVLSLDADEALDATLCQAILEVKARFDQEGYLLNRLTNYCGTWIRHCGWHPDWKLRLFDRRKGLWAGRNPHDRFTLVNAAATAKLEGQLLHYSFYTEEEHLAQIEKFSSIGAQSLYEDGVRSNWLKLIYKPLARFVKGFILKVGFLDGYHGWLVCKNSTYASYLKYAKLLQLQKQQ